MKKNTTPQTHEEKNSQYNEFQMEAMKGTPKFSDYENPAFLYSTVYNSLLSQIATGKIDATWLAKKELANRGLDLNGTWIGFEKAAIENFK